MSLPPASTPQPPLPAAGCVDKQVSFLALWSGLPEPTEDLLEQEPLDLGGKAGAYRNPGLVRPLNESPGGTGGNPLLPGPKQDKSVSAVCPST